MKKIGYIMTLTTGLLMTMVLALSVTAGQEQPKSHYCITRFEGGAINWSTGHIFSVGKASPQGKTDVFRESVPGSARADANRKIIDILKSIKINNALSIQEYASENDIILAGIEKTARDSSILKQYYTSALAVEIMIETSMFGGFLQLVLPDEIRQIPQLTFDEEPILSRVMEVNLYTGMIIDARGLGVEPVLNPVIVSEQGHEVYSPVFISREFAVQKGVCKYLCSMNQALKDKRIGNNPLVFKTLRKGGKRNTAIVISMVDYRKLEKISERHDFLKECRVIIVKDQ